LPLVFIAFQLVLGRRNLGLPRVLARRSVARATFARMAAAIAPWLARLERALRPRWPEFLGPMAERLAGLLAILLGLLLSLPIPLTNIPLAVPLVLIGLGLAERDGLILAIGLAVGAIVAIAVLALGSALILAALAWLAALI
ncbi:MAG: exopolysaccharide biosynthesis protein, partial [Dongiales bacterium]